MANPLVDEKALPDPGQYGPDPTEIRNGDYSSLSPITSGGDWLKGTGPWSDAKELGENLRNGTVIEKLTSLATVELDLLGTVMDPIGTALSMLVGWMIEHLKPLKAALDGLAGNPDMIEGRSTTWDNINNAMQAAAKDLEASIKPGTSSWTGDAAENYRGSSTVLAKSMGAVGDLSSGMGALVKITGVAVAAVRDTVRDLISTLVAELIEDAIEEAASLGLATPVVVEQALGSIFRCSTRVAKTIKELLEAIAEAGEIVSKLVGLFSNIYKILKELPEATKVNTPVPA